MSDRDTLTPAHQITRPTDFYPSFNYVDTEALYCFTGLPTQLPANTPVTLLARPRLVGQPNLVYHQPTNACPGGAYAAVSDLYLADYSPHQAPTEIILEFLNISEFFTGENPPRTAAALLATPEQKDAALQRLNITRQPGQGHLAAWVLAMARANGLPAVLPQTTIADAALDDPAIAKWIWFLA